MNAAIIFPSDRISCNMAQTFGPNVKERCGDLRTTRADFERGWPQIHAVPGGLKTADGHLSPCVQTWSESESCYQARTKARIIVVVFWVPKIASEAISQNQIPTNFPWEACPQTPLASAYTLTMPMLRLRPFALIILVMPMDYITLRVNQCESVWL